MDGEFGSDQLQRQAQYDEWRPLHNSCFIDNDQ